MQRPTAVLTRFELLPVRATSRTVWLFVRLWTDEGVSGIGEASDAFGFAGTSAEEIEQMRTELATFFESLEGRSPLDIDDYRKRGLSRARTGGLVTATAFSSIEQALWDLSGKLRGVPAYELLGGGLRNKLEVYANINRASLPRTPEGFASTARRAAAEGFQAVKLAPFDGFPRTGTAAEIATAVDVGIESIGAVRSAVGKDVAVLVDCHSFFDVELADDVAHRLEPFDIAWYEEPVAPDRVATTREIADRVMQPLAGGELLFGVEGFEPLCKSGAVDVIMPDVKHCGGLQELMLIAQMAHENRVAVAPHNPSGPVSTAASVAVSAAIGNFKSLELQWGEVDWRSSVMTPPELFVDGTISVPDRPGFGVELNDAIVAAHPA
jgi:galactonate dehydratase